MINEITVRANSLRGVSQFLIQTKRKRQPFLITLFSCAWHVLRSQLRVHENTSCVICGCLRLLSGAPDNLTHPVRSLPQFRGLWLLATSCSHPQVKCKRLVGGCSLSHFVYPKFRPISTTAAPQSRGVCLSGEKARTVNLKRTTSCCA